MKESKIRHIYKVGNSHVVSLPPKFLKKHGLVIGDEVVIVSNDVLVILNPNISEEQNEGLPRIHQ